MTHNFQAGWFVFLLGSVSHTDGKLLGQGKAEQLGLQIPDIIVVVVVLWFVCFFPQDRVSQ